MVKPPHVAIQPDERVRPTVGVRQRLIYDNSTVDHSWTLDEVKDLNDRNEARVHAKVPVKLIAVDRKVAIASIVKNGAHGVPVGALAGESPLLDAILALFDYVWDVSARLRPNEIGLHREESPPLRAADRQLLSLLVAGLTAESIAAHLGVSVRTVERRTRALMDAARVHSRTQLAWKAATRRWL
jgi:DNA-binding NarL/FixJ family response regulator